MICNLIRFPFAVVGTVTNLLVDWRDAKRMADALSALEPFDFEAPIDSASVAASADAGQRVGSRPVIEGLVPPEKPQRDHSASPAVTVSALSDSAVSPSLVPPGDGDRLGSPSSPPEATEPHQLAGLTFDELTFAAAVVANYAATLPRQSRAVLCTTDELHELAARLTAAANVAPTP